MEYDGLTHNATSTVQISIYGIFATKEFAINYSSQLRFRMAFCWVIWSISIPTPTAHWCQKMPVLHFVSNGVTGEVQISGCTIAGWQKALIALRTDNLVNGDDLEFQLQDLSHLR